MWKGTLEQCTGIVVVSNGLMIDRQAEAFCMVEMRTQHKFEAEEESMAEVGKNE